jgi:hypothetical protein
VQSHKEKIKINLFMLAMKIVIPFSKLFSFIINGITIYGFNNDTELSIRIIQRGEQHASLCYAPT